MPLASLSSPRALARFARLLVAANVAIFLVLAGTTAIAVLSSRHAYQERALSSAENMAHVMSLNIGAEIKQIDNALVSTIHGATRLAGGGSLDPALVSQIADEQRALVPQIETIRMSDRNGLVINHNGGQDAEPVSLSDREYFKAAQTDPTRLIISEPLQGRIVKKWGVILARARVGQDGQFEGLASANLSSDHFIDMFDEVVIGHYGAVTLRSGSLRLIARYAPSAPPLTDSDMGNTRVSPELKAALARDPDHGSFITLTLFDGIERASAYQRVPDCSLLVLIGLSTDESYLPWKREAFELVGLSVLLQLFIGGLSLLIYWQHRRQASTLRQLGQLTAEQAALLDNELVSMARFRGRHIIWHNKALALMFGYGEQSLAGQPSRLFYLLEKDYEAVGRGYSQLAAGQQFRSQVQMLRQDGRVMWIDLSGVQLNKEESLWMMVDITAVKESESQARHVAMHDGLTGLGNRTQLPQALEQALLQARAGGRRLAVCYIDLDGFKAVNDTHGHAAGDELLRQVAQRMTECVRGGDAVVRMGGDEFVIVLTGLGGAQEVEAVLLRLLASLQRSFTLEDGMEVTIGASIGIASYPENGSNADALMGRADQAMYEAKRGGKNRLVFSAASDT